MRNYLIKSFLALACLTLVLVPLPVKAQSSDLGLSIQLNNSTIVRPGSTGVFALVTNNTSSRMRTTVTFTAVAPCGTEYSLGYNRLTLSAGESIVVSTSLWIPADACVGSYSVTVTAKSGGGGGKNSTLAASPSATAFLVVQ